MSWTRNPGRGVALAALVSLSALVAAGCSKKLVTQLVPNKPPEVRLTGAPAARDSLNPDFYAYTLQWVGFDPDGRVDHFLYAIDPADPHTPDRSDTTWHVTTRNEQTFFFSARDPIQPINPQNTKSESPHVFAIYAVDNEGMVSARGAVRAFFSFTQAPIVQVVEPVATAGFSPTVTPTTTIRWSGSDPDGQFTNKPVRWTFRLFGQSNPDFPGVDFISFATSIVGRDSLRRYYAPEFRGWTSVGADTTSFQFRNLNPQSTYLFVLTGFDEAGAYDPIFSPDKNMLKFSVSFAGTFGPILTMFNQFFFYQYPTGGFDLAESRIFRLEVPADERVVFNWVAAPPPGSEIKRYRWVMDLVDLSDETARSNEATDWYHWSTWSLNTTSATIGPFPPLPTDPPDPNEHKFYIEAEDTNGLLSIGIIFFRAIRASLEKPLLVVDDTRYRPDYRSGGGQIVDQPSGPWPTLAELDTFLFARGGVPWHSYPGYGGASPTLSSPGVFTELGYTLGVDYDTVGTRGRFGSTGFVPLSILGQYRHVLWYTEANGAASTGNPIDPANPITALRLISSPGRPVVLSTYISQGGKVWLSGGGAAAASLFPWNRANTSPSIYTARDLELVPGRMMYDFAHWREGITFQSAFWARRFGTTSFGVGSRPGRGWAGQPDYSLLPPTLHLKTGGDGKPPDPLPPLREGGPGFFYLSSYPAEFIHLNTFIREDYNPDPDILQEISTLDTLYLTALVAFGERPVMTYYHGLENTPFVFSGFNVWAWKRDECVSLIGFVLQQIWGLAPSGPAAYRAAR
jgi:hypothetical protein